MMMVSTDRHCDGGSFERLVREADKAAKGDEDLKQRLLTERVVREFVNKLVQGRAAAAADYEISVLGFHVPKRNRTRPPPHAEDHHPDHHQNKKRHFDQIINKKSSSSSTITEEPEKRQQHKKRRKITNRNHAAAAATQVLEVVPEMPERFKNKIEEMGGSKIVLVIQKKLTFCDTTQRHNRFSIPIGNIKNDFLEAEEKERLIDRGEVIENVKLIQPCVSTVNVNFKKWDMDNTYVLNLTRTWHKEVVSNTANQLQIGSRMQLYAFRLEHNNNDLCFALVNLDLVNN